MYSFKTLLLFAIAMGFAMVAAAQQGTVRGNIKDTRTGEAIPFANILVVELGTGAATDFDGNYQINLDPGSYTLQATFVGYSPQEKKVTVKAGEIVVVDFAINDQSDQITILPVLPSIGMKSVSLEEASVVAIRRAPKEPGAQVTVTEEQIAPLNLGQDLPFMLRFTPSIVVTSDAGNGVGYTGMRIRGSDQTRINVTINGIPYNDPESQGVFWVNLPDFSSSVNDVQIQRGVGSSTNGPGAFGGSVSLNTLRIPEQAYASISNSFGSFNTLKHTIGFGSGRIGNHFKIEGRLSQITSDGFIDRAESDLKSYYVTGSWDNGRSSIQAVVFGGNERTYQSWFGTPQSRIENDVEGMLAHAANEGYSEEQLENLMNSGRTYNFYLYENEVDDYSQDHYQLHLKHRFGSRLTAQLSGHYTYGRGFFEQQRLGDDLSDYGLNSVVLNAIQQFSDATDADGNPINEGFAGNYSWDQVEITHDIVTDADGNPITNDDGETLLNSIAQISQSDVIRRRWLSNDFYGVTYSLNYRANRFNAVVGGAYNDYDGDHFGELIWMSNPAGSQPGDLYYLNNGRKKDFNVYAKANYRFRNKLEVFGDIQYRRVTYFTEGVDADRRNISVGDSLDFVNPKVGLNYYINNRNNVYVSYSIGNREPVRNDYIDALEGRRPEAETLQDLEFGFRRNTEKYRFQLNFYNMVYDNQLVLTGELNDVGSAVRTNVENSYRRGVEMQVIWQVIPGLQWGVNATYSQNKIEDYNYFLYDYTNGFDIIEQNFGETDISFSPDIIANSTLSFRFFENDKNTLEAAWMTTYVSDQFLDNTSDENRKIDAYLVNDFRLTYSLFNKGMKELQLNAMVNNVLDEEYSSNGYTYSYRVGETITENFFYPQAGRNFMVGLNLLF